MKMNRVTKVRPVADERVLLDDNLRPLCMFLRCNLLLPDFSDQEKENCVFYIARLVFTMLVVLLIMSNTAFELYQMMFVLPQSNETLNIGLILIVGLCGVFSTTFQYQFFIYRKEIKQFLKDWKTFEIQSLENFFETEKKNEATYLIVLYAFLTFMITFGLFFYNWLDPEKPCFLSYYPIFRNKISVITLSLITAVCEYFTHIYLFLGEIVPPLFYYRTGCVIEDLVREFKKVSELTYSKSLNMKQCSTLTDDEIVISNLNIQFRKGRPFGRIWKKYETVFNWVNRANDLLGTLILLGYSGVFIFSSISMYIGLFFISKDPKVAVIFVSIFLCSALRTVLMNRLMSHLPLSCGKLKSTLALVLSRKWHVLPEDDRLLLLSFQTRLDRDELTASPFRLYFVNPNNVLSMLSVIVTYTIVLLQF